MVSVLGAREYEREKGAERGDWTKGDGFRETVTRCDAHARRDFFGPTGLGVLNDGLVTSAGRLRGPQS